MDFYNIAISGSPTEIKTAFKTIPEIYTQETLNNALYKSITLTNKPNMENIVTLIGLGAKFTKIDYLREYCKLNNYVEIYTLIDFTESVPDVTIDKREIGKSKNWFSVTGNTQKYAKLFQKMGGKHINAGNNDKNTGKWIFPMSIMSIFERKTEPKVVDNPSFSSAPSINSIELHDIVITSPFDCVIGYMSIDYERPYLFEADNQHWNSVGQYLMYKKYEGTAKGDHIKDADTLKFAKTIYEISDASPIYHPRQLIDEVHIKTIGKSTVSPFYMKNREKLFILANKKKFKNADILTKLKSTGSAFIVNKNNNDEFGYEGNLLGTTLMGIRGTKVAAKRCNNLTINGYNDKYYVVRGDPDDSYAGRLRMLAASKAGNSTGIHIRGKLDPSLIGGPGWLIPNNNYIEARKMVFETLPDETKSKMMGNNWVQDQLLDIVEIATKISEFNGNREICASDIKFTLKYLYRQSSGRQKLDENGEAEIESDVVPPQSNEFLKIISDKKMSISENGVRILWEHIYHTLEFLIGGLCRFKTVKNRIDTYDESVLDTSVISIDDLTDCEVIVVGSFFYIFTRLKKLREDANDAKCAITACKIMLGGDHFENVRKKYAGLKKNRPIDIDSLYDVYGIKNKHIKQIIPLLPTEHHLAGKLKLLFFLMLDYILNDLDETNSIVINKRLLVLNKYYEGKKMEWELEAIRKAAEAAAAAQNHKHSESHHGGDNDSHRDDHEDRGDHPDTENNSGTEKEEESEYGDAIPIHNETMSENAENSTVPVPDNDNDYGEPIDVKKSGDDGGDYNVDDNDDDIDDEI